MLQVENIDVIVEIEIGSTGHGGRSFTSYQWTAKSVPSSTSLDYVNNLINSTTTSSSLKISSSYLVSGTYSFYLTLTNFLGYSTISNTLSVLRRSSSIPVITISGGSSQTVYPNNALSIFASVI